MEPPDWTCHPSGVIWWRFGKEVLPDSEPYRKSQGSLVTGGEVRRSSGGVRDGGNQGRPKKDLRILLTGKHDSHAHEAEGPGDRFSGLRLAGFFFLRSALYPDWPGPYVVGAVFLPTTSCCFGPGSAGSWRMASITDSAVNRKGGTDHHTSCFESHA